MAGGMDDPDWVGRQSEADLIETCLALGKNILLEGPVGSGKTFLASHILSRLGRPVFRIDGDSRYSEQKLAGWFDPPSVFKRGYQSDTFFPGPLLEAMKSGGVLFINELNRLPEGVQNILLPAIDERRMNIPRLGDVFAQTGFQVLATQNPKEFVATSQLSEAILDRFEWIFLDYQDESDELEIVLRKTKNSRLARCAVQLVRGTRHHPRMKRGASLRAALSIAEIADYRIQAGHSFEQAFLDAVMLALPNRLEVELDLGTDSPARSELNAILTEETNKVLLPDEKKKSI